MLGRRQDELTVGKVALITGAARRIGRATAIRFHRFGMNIVIHYSASKEDAEDLCCLLNRIRPDSAMTICLDLAKNLEHFDEKMIQPILEKFGRLDVLVNNANLFLETPMGEITVDQIDSVMRANVYAPLLLSQAAAHALADSLGVIVNITDAATNKMPYIGYSVCDAAKGAIKTLTYGLANELKPFVRVVAVAPGIIGKPEGKNKLSEEQESELLSAISTQHEGEYDDVAKAIYGLVVEDHRNATVVVVDGGMTRAGKKIGTAKFWGERRLPTDSVEDASKHAQDGVASTFGR